MAGNPLKKIIGNDSEEAIEQVEYLLKRLQREVKKTSRELEEQQEKNITLIKHIEELNKQHSILSQEVEATNLKLKEATKQIEKATSEIQVFKPSVETKLINQITQKLESELANATNKINAEANGFAQAKEVFSKHLKQSKETIDEMEKLKTVISKIDEKDFTLEAYAKQLDKNDREKVKLLKRIDELESMLAKMKRK